MTDFPFRGYDRAALDAQYNNRLKVPDCAAQLARWPQGGNRSNIARGARRSESWKLARERAAPRGITLATTTAADSSREAT